MEGREGRGRREEEEGGRREGKEEEGREGRKKDKGKGGGGMKEKERVAEGGKRGRTEESNPAISHPGWGQSRCGSAGEVWKENIGTRREQRHSCGGGCRLGHGGQVCALCLCGYGRTALHHYQEIGELGRI